MKKLIFLAMVLPLVGCASDVERRAFKATAQMVKPADILDSKYVSFTTTDWIDWLGRLRLKRAYKKDTWDCEDYAQYLIVHAKLSWANKKGSKGTPAIGLCIVRFKEKFLGIAPSSGNHALTVFRNGRNEWWFYEPQTGYAASVTSTMADGKVTIVKTDF